MRTILLFTVKIIEMFELHVSMPGMWSAEYQATIPLKFRVTMPNYANVLPINQSKSLPGLRVVMTSLDGINGRSIQTLLRGKNDSKQSNEIQAMSTKGRECKEEATKYYNYSANKADEEREHRAPTFHQNAVNKIRNETDEESSRGKFKVKIIFFDATIGNKNYTICKIDMRSIFPTDWEQPISLFAVLQKALFYNEQFKQR